MENGNYTKSKLPVLCFVEQCGKWSNFLVRVSANALFPTISHSSTKSHGIEEVLNEAKG